jgi:hypothetical protein
MNAPKNFFLQLGIIVTLYASIVSFLMFIFGLIDHLLPNATGYYYDFTNSGIRYSISVLIVMFPLFLWLSRLHRKMIAGNLDLKESKLRKWLLYFTLFLAGLTIAIDVIVLINTFLSGHNLALSFILKVVAILIVALKVFYFYLQDLKGKWDANPGQAKLAAIVVGVVVLVSVIIGIIVIGSPSRQRDLLNDQTRLQDLQSIQFQITEYFQDKGVLPTTLKDIIDPIRGTIVPKDPVSLQEYEYKATGPLSFNLCAVFTTDSNAPENQNPSRVVYPDLFESEYWNHKIGLTCFDRTIDKDRFPVRKLAQ